MLAQLARELSLPSLLIIGYTEKKSLGNQKDALLADALEAIIAAIYLDSNFDNVSKVVGALYEDIYVDSNSLDIDDSKTILQEMIQEEFKLTPTYKTVDSSGPDHEKRFKVVVEVASKNLAYGWGDSKKKASQEAAKKALQKLQTNRSTGQFQIDMDK